jgi:membrane-associated phospholipid phosphatase
MTRGIGGIEAIQGTLPPGSGDVLALLTQLGDVWLLIVVLSLVYWFRARRPGAYAIMTLLGGLALVVGLKAIFELPRPPSMLRLVVVDGFGFPSGHAIAATVGWGVLALVLDEPNRRIRVGGAGAIVAVVAFTRVGLGVHYVVDVIAGIAIGLAYLGLVWTIAGREPERAGFVAAVGAFVGLVLSGGASDAVLLVGGTLGGLLAWRYTDVPHQPWQRNGVLPATIGGGVVGGTLVVGYGGPLLAPIAFLLGLVSVAIVIGLPAITEGVAGIG